MLDIRYFGMDVNGKYLPQTILVDEIKDLLQEYPIGGVILFKENLENSEQIKALTLELQGFGSKNVSNHHNIKYPVGSEVSANNFHIHNPITPIFIAIDEEGGVVSRIGLDTIGNMALGAINDTNITHSNARLIGAELNNLGINFNLAPVVDINSNLHNPIIGVRSFGDNPELVTKHAKAFMEGLHDTGIISCAKHFPGHGDTTTDTHHGSTVLNKSKTDIEQCELYPYKKLIATGVSSQRRMGSTLWEKETFSFSRENNLLDAVMTAHIVVPALDGSTISINGKDVTTPATFSHEILTNILRKNMNFNGLIVTDALDMKAISNNFDAVTATIQSIKAGCDIILMPVRIWDSDGISKFKEYFKEVYMICSRDVELQARVQESYQRIITVKNKLLKNSFDTCLGEWTFNNQHDLAQKAITLYKNSDNHIPFKITHDSNILIIAENNNLLETTYLEAKNIAADRYNINQAPNFGKLLLDYKNIDIYQLKEELYKYSHAIILTYNLKGMDSSQSLNDNGVSRNDNEVRENDFNLLDYSSKALHTGRRSVNNTINELFITLNNLQIPYVMFSCRNPYDINYARNATTNILLYGITGFDQTNYKITPFTLNLKAALNKILAMDLADTYNKLTPVSI